MFQFEKLLLFAALATASADLLPFAQLRARDIAPQGRLVKKTDDLCPPPLSVCDTEEFCGEVCCNVGNGVSCEFGEYCHEENGEVTGCCPVGEVCTGPGGTKSSTIVVTSTTDTSPTPPPEEPEPTYEPEPEPTCTDDEPEPEPEPTDCPPEETEEPEPEPEPTDCPPEETEEPEPEPTEDCPEEPEPEPTDDTTTPPPPVPTGWNTTTTARPEPPETTQISPNATTPPPETTPPPPSDDNLASATRGSVMLALVGGAIGLLAAML